MPTHNLQYLNRNEYIASISAIDDTRTSKFANMSLSWWDKQFGWYIKGCVALADSDDNHLCYIFYKIDRYNEYITIHNIFTPLAKRRHGYANILLTLIFDLALTQKVKRFKLTSISNSLDFYLALGFVYWGVNSVGDYYCDLPMPHDGLLGVDYMIKNISSSILMGKNFEKICAKVGNNSKNLSTAQMLIYECDILKMGTHYRLQSLADIKSTL